LFGAIIKATIIIFVITLFYAAPCTIRWTTFVQTYPGGDMKQHMVEYYYSPYSLKLFALRKQRTYLSLTDFSKSLDQWTILTQTSLIFHITYGNYNRVTYKL